MGILFRLLNAFLFILLPTCMYITFSVKNNVHQMQREARSLTMQIAQEKEMIDVYRVQWATIASIMNISQLQKKLLPEYQTLSYNQMQNPQLLDGSDVSAQTHVASATGRNTQMMANVSYTR